MPGKKKVISRSSKEENTHFKPLKRLNNIPLKETIEDRLLEDYSEIIQRNSEDPNKFTCIPCQFFNSPFSSGLWYNCKSHVTNSKHHQTNIEKWEEITQHGSNSQKDRVPSNEDVFIERNSNNYKDLTPEVKKELDYIYTKFILQYRLPFSLAKPLNSLLQQLSSNYDPIVLKRHTINRNNVSLVSQNASAALKAHLLDELQLSPFSLSVDSSSDVNGNSYFAVCARYLEENCNDRPTTKLLSILPITTCSEGETLYKKLTEEVLINEEIVSNFVGIATDNGSNMTGVRKGVASRLKATYKHITTIKDICHTFNNIFTKALKAMPAHILKIVTDICSHFHYSTQRSSLLKEIMTEKNMKHLEILHMSKTRWLSVRNCVERLLDTWPALEDYFNLYGNKTEKSVLY